MIAIQGFFDGKTIRPLEPVRAPTNTRVVITFLEPDRVRTIPPTRLEDVAGCLKWTGPARTLTDMEKAIEIGARERKP